MGKSRMEMKRIENHKARMYVFGKKRTSLLKKAKELSILCDVKILIIIYDQDGQKVEIWPDSNEEAERIIERFEQQKVSRKPWESPSASNKTRFGPRFSVLDHKNMIDHYSENELQNMVSELDAKIAAVVDIIQSKRVLTATEMLRGCQGTESLNKGKGKEVIVIDREEPVNIQQYQSFQTVPHYPNQNFMSYPQFDPSAYTSNIPFVPLPTHYVDPYSMQQPPYMNVIPSFHYDDPASVQQLSYYDPNIYHIQPFIYYPIMPGFPPT